MIKPWGKTAWAMFVASDRLDNPAPASPRTEWLHGAAERALGVDPCALVIPDEIAEEAGRHITQTLLENLHG